MAFKHPFQLKQSYNSMNLTPEPSARCPPHQECHSPGAHSPSLHRLPYCTAIPAVSLKIQASTMPVIWGLCCCITCIPGDVQLGEDEHCDSRSPHTCSLRAPRLEQRWTATLGKTVDGETDTCLKLKQNELQDLLTWQ